MEGWSVVPLPGLSGAEAVYRKGIPYRKLRSAMRDAGLYSSQELGSGGQLG